MTPRLCFSAARTLKFGRQAGNDDEDDDDGASGYDSYWKNLASGGEAQQNYTDDEDDEEEDGDEEDDEDEPLSLEWPDTPRKQATYLFLLPIVFPLWLTVPDVRNPVR